jgi:hypothetical protein
MGERGITKNSTYLSSHPVGEMARGQRGREFYSLKSYTAVKSYDPPSGYADPLDDERWL